MPIIGRLLSDNYVLDASLLAFLVASALKVIIVLIRYRRFDLRRFIGAGGMPSSHSAVVCAMATAVYRTEGMRSTLFGVAAIVAIVVMYDAAGIRRAAGEQAKIINELLRRWNEGGEQDMQFMEKKLKELLGHTPVQVFIGALLGIAIAWAYV